MPHSQPSLVVARHSQLLATGDKTRLEFPQDERRRRQSVCKCHSFPSLPVFRRKSRPRHVDYVRVKTRSDNSTRTTAKSQAKKSAADWPHLLLSALLSDPAGPFDEPLPILRAYNSSASRSQIAADHQAPLAL